jgi:TRAP-type mannitol/chloroaromatic compound transport system permease small subunit
MRHLKLELVGGVLLIASFFLIWFRFPDAALAGYEAARASERLTAYLALRGPGPVWAAYALYLIPLLGLLTILSGLSGRGRVLVGAVAGTLPYALVVFLWIRLGNDLLTLMAIGFTLALVGGALTLFGLLGGLRVAAGIDWFTTRLGYLMYAAALFMVAIGASYVIIRYTGRTFGFFVPGANTIRELQMLLFNMVFLLAAALVLKQNAHVRVDLIYSTLKLRAKAWIDIFGASVFLIPFCLLGLYLSHGFVMRSWAVREVSPNPGGLPLYPAKTLIIAGFLLLILQGISETIKNVAFLSGRLERQEEPPEVVVIPEKTELL